MIVCRIGEVNRGRKSSCRDGKRRKEERERERDKSEKGR